MAYAVYMDGVILPVTPSKWTLKIKGSNKTLNLINDGEINLLKSLGLTDISYECLLPQSKYPFAKYPDGFRAAAYYLELFKQLKIQRKVFSFIVIRERPNGKHLFDTNMKVSLEEYQIIEDADKYGFDIGVSVVLKQYRHYATKEFDYYEQIQHDGSLVPMAVEINHRESDKSIVKTYTVQLGDALYTIAKAVYGDAEKYVDIYEANKAMIDAANDGTDATKYWIHPGQILTIPS